MMQDKQQSVALLRYGAIAPIIARLDENYPNKSSFFREVSEKGIVEPDGSVHHYVPTTIEKWYLDYQKHGFDALIPKGRSDAGLSCRFDDELQDNFINLMTVIKTSRWNFWPPGWTVHSATLSPIPQPKTHWSPDQQCRKRQDDCCPKLVCRIESLSLQSSLFQPFTLYCE